MVPVTKELSKNFYFFCFTWGILHISVKIPATGYISGQVIHVVCEVKNQSNVKIKTIKAGLIRITNYISSSPYARIAEAKRIARCAVTYVENEKEKMLDLLLRVPCSSPPSSTSSTVIQIKYVLKVEAVTSGLHGNLKCHFPITIGTIPLC